MNFQIKLSKYASLRDVTGGINGYPVPSVGQLLAAPVEELKEIAQKTGADFIITHRKSGWSVCELHVRAFDMEDAKQRLARCVEGEEDDPSYFLSNDVGIAFATYDVHIYELGLYLEDCVPVIYNDETHSLMFVE